MGWNLALSTTAPLSNWECDEEDRIDAAVLLMGIDKCLAEKTIIQLLQVASTSHFDFYTELLDVLLVDWVLQNKIKEMKSLLDKLPIEGLRDYAESAWKNISNMRN